MNTFKFHEGQKVGVKDLNKSTGESIFFKCLGIIVFMLANKDLNVNMYAIKDTEGEIKWFDEAVLISFEGGYCD